jgi:8-oxo-dGTP diphosphatase
VRVTVDIVIFTVRDGVLEVLLVRRGIAPYKGQWAIPGGFVLDGESLDTAALRELREETGVADVYLEQLYSFGEPGRDPRGRVVTVAYFALIASERVSVAGGSDATDARWWEVGRQPDLAFDHDKILAYAVQRLRGKIGYTAVGLELLPEKFTLTELQQVYEAILGEKLDKRNFRRRIESLGLLKALDEYAPLASGRPAQLYSGVYARRDAFS